MKKLFAITAFLFALFCYSQKAGVQKKTAIQSGTRTKVITPSVPLKKVNDSVPGILPFKLNGKFGFKDQHGNTLIKPEYSDVGFFAEDCALLHSPKQNVKKFGSENYASVRFNNEDYRINRLGKRVYKFNAKDLGKCPSVYKSQLFHAYILNEKYGIIEDAVFENPGDYSQFTIYPMYQYLHILEGDDLKNPFIIAAHDDRFGIINLENKMVIPFQYRDIKRNLSWKLARLFEVSEDGINYFYVDINNNRY